MRNIALLVACIFYISLNGQVKSDTTQLFYPFEEETVNTGFLDQKQSHLTGAYSFVCGDRLELLQSSTFSQSLEGTLSGLVTIETNSEPGKASVMKFNRGISGINGNQPLIVVDGVVYTNTDYEYLSASEVESVMLLKDASATAMYGSQGANGVLLITTKSGRIGENIVTFNYNHSFQQMLNAPRMLSSYEYASLRRQAWFNDGSEGDAPYSDQEIAKFRDGTDPFFPNNDYYNYFMKNFGNMDRLNLSLSGGNDIIRYYTNIGYMHQSSLFNLDQRQSQYNAAPSLNWFNVRSKVDVKISDHVTGFINIFGNVNRDKNASAQSNDYIYDRLFSMTPAIFGPTTLGYEYGGEVVTTESESDPIYGLLNRGGYSVTTGLSIVAHAGVKFDLDFITKGLDLTGAVSYHTTSDRELSMLQDFERYVGSYDDYGMLLFNKKGDNLNTPISSTVDGGFEYNITYYGNLNYSRSFDSHDVNLAAYTYFRKHMKRKPDNIDVPSSLLPFFRHNSGVNVSYAYEDKYLLRVDMGYTGSDQFSRKNRYVFTPAVSAGWVFSREGFMKDLGFIDFGKIRVSYGLSANDEFDTGDIRYEYMDYVNSRGSIKMFANPDIRPEIFSTGNIGLDLALFKHLNVSVDVFDKSCNNMLVDASVLTPSYSGIPSSAFPKVNDGAVRSRGIELQIDYSSKIGRDWSYSLYVDYLHSTSKVLESGEIEYPTGDGNYAYPTRSKGYPVGQSFGYIVDYSVNNGYISTMAELKKYKQMYEAGGIGTPRLGDFAYKDLNNDNIINEKDMAPIGKGGYPSDYLSFGFNLNWKRLSLDVMFQGAFNYWGGSAVFIENSREGIFLDIHKYAWTDERFRNDEEIRYPALTYKTSSTSMLANDFNIVNRSYVRLKNVALSYKLPEKWMEKVRLGNCYVRLSCNNVFTVSNMLSREIDPEIMSATKFNPFRVFNIGVNLSY